MPHRLIERVSDTAFWVAHYRVVESQRPGALFRDSLAARLAGERGQKIAADLPMSRMMGWVLAIRTTIIDEFVQQGIAEGVDTVLNLGAGLDTRPSRMELPPQLQWIEVDDPAMIEFKEQCLVRYLAEPADRLRRPVPLPLTTRIVVAVRALFASRKRREAFRRFAAYVLVEPSPPSFSS